MVWRSSRYPRRSVLPPAAGETVRVGVLALQGDFREHRAILGALGADVPEIRRGDELDGLDGIVIPGGESTTIGKLAAQYGVLDRLRERAAAGMPVWGTCAGAIFIAKDVPGHRDPLARLMDITVERNAFGRQVDSFEVDLAVPVLGARPFRGIFIRAPKISRTGPQVEVLARLADGTVVAARERDVLVTAFHPELTADRRFHRYFLGVVQRSREADARAPHRSRVPAAR